MNHLVQKLTVCVLFLFVSWAYADDSLLKIDDSLIQVDDSLLQLGAGEFQIDGGVGRSDLAIDVHYNMPKNFTAESPVLMVLSGSGRTASKYRDRWIQASEKYGVLILSPEYSKVFYPKSANYNLARMVKKENGQFVVNKKQGDWIYSDLDRIFDLVVKSTGSGQKAYDFFGHSAGGQLGHRFAMFSPKSKSRVILAANSGWYTSIDYNTPFPYGLAGAPFNTEQMESLIEQSFTKQLVVFLGEKDDENEKRGSLRRGNEVDKQGLSRIARGMYFYDKAKQHAKMNEFEFNWSVVVVPGVGHSSTKMSLAAAKFLYAKD